MRFILVVDADCDKDFKFEDLGIAIHKYRAARPFAPALKQDIEHFPLAVDRPPHIHSLSGNRDHDFGEMPLDMRLWSGLTQVSRNPWSNSVPMGAILAVARNSRQLQLEFLAEAPSVMICRTDACRTRPR
jgi:hypothetical protein